jgi:hypothetical protein
MNRDQAFLNQLRIAFQPRNIDDCLDRRTEFDLYVCESGVDNTPCHFGQSVDMGFHIDNPDQLEIHLLRVDHCLLSNQKQGQKRCDCVIFDQRYFCLIELKLKIKQMRLSAAVKEAETQLEETIRFLEQELSTDDQFFGFVREAYIVIPIEPKVKVYPTQRASFGTRQEQFFVRNRVGLYLENSKSFAVSANSG